MRVRPEADKALGWAFRPDENTLESLNRGKRKIKDYPFHGKPHEGGSMAEALAEERRLIDRKRKPKRRRRMARKVNLKELDALKKGKLSSKKKTVEVAASNGKMIPLKKICSDLGVDAKAARVKLRRLIEKGEIDWHDRSARWEFSPKRAKEVRAHLEE